MGPRERPAAADAETVRKHGGKLERLVRVAEDFPYGRHPSRAKDFKTMGFNGALWILSAAVGRKYPAGGMQTTRSIMRVYYGLPRTQSALAMT